jgi:tungstate transport system substrate-binding protein
MARLAAAFLAALTTAAGAQQRPADGPLVIAATTSVEDSGLFEHIVPRFTAKSGITKRAESPFGWFRAPRRSR